MGKGRSTLVGLAATVAIAGMALALPAGAASAGAGSADSPTATSAKKKCKKGKGKNATSAKKKCKKGKKGGSYVPGRYSGTYAENNVDLFFNVAGGRVYTGPFDTFYIDAPCSEGLSDISTIEPVQASIRNDGSFSWVGRLGRRLGPERLLGPLDPHRADRGEVRSPTACSPSVPTRTRCSTKTCSGSTHFTASWYASGTLVAAS